MTQPKFTIVHPDQQRVRWVGGQRQAVIVGGPETGGRYALSHSTIAVGGGAKEHRHSNEAESFYVIAGTVRFSIGSQTILLGKGSFLHAEPGQKYAFEVVGSETCEVMIMYAPAGLERFIEEAGLPDRQGAEARSIAAAGALMEAAPAYGVHYMATEKP